MGNAVMLTAEDGVTKQADPAAAESSVTMGSGGIQTKRPAAASPNVTEAKYSSPLNDIAGSASALNLIADVEGDQSKVRWGGGNGGFGWQRKYQQQIQGVCGLACCRCISFG